MYAIIKSGGKQHKVKAGQTIFLERLPNGEGEEVYFNDVLMVADGADIKVGQPLVDGAAVKGKVVGHPRGKKLIIFKKIRRHGKQRKMGHRQELTQVQIESISVN